MNNELTVINKAITSREVAEWTGKEHCHVLRDIRNEIDSLGKTPEGAKYAESNYGFIENTKVKGVVSNAHFVITKIGVQQIAMRYDAQVRMKVNMKLEELSTQPQITDGITGSQLLVIAQQMQKLEAERDYAIKTKSWISDKKTASAMGVAGAAVKKVKALEVKIDASTDYATVKKMEIMHKRKFHWKPLKDFSVNNNIKIKKAIDVNYGDVNSYHKNAWQAVYGVDVKSTELLIN